MVARVRPKLRRCFAWSAVVLAVLLVLDGILLAIWWPFKEGSLVRSLEHFSSSEVRIGSFKRIYFPHPGYIAEGITFSRGANGHKVQLASVGKLVSRASWFAMLSFTHRLAELRLRELHVSLPPEVPAPMKQSSSFKEKTTITSLVADGSVLEVAGHSTGSRKLRFDFHRLTLENVEKDKSIKIRMLTHLPEPSGDLAVTGSFGPLEGKDGGRTPLSGSFRLARADLSTFQAVRGMLAGSGTFRGTLTHCEVRGDARVPDFALTSTQHEAGLRVRFDALLNGKQGDVTIRSADAHVLHTTLLAQGTIGAAPGQQGKTVALNIEASQARVEDLLWIFSAAKTPAMDGPITLHAKAVLPPGNEEFLRKVRLDGDFAIKDAEFEHGNTQGKVDEMSERARKKKDDSKGSDPPAVRSDLEGRVDLRDGTATLSRLKFATPGAVAHGQGTYDLLNKRIDLHGRVAIQASLSKAAGGGLKSVLLIPLDPFFKKKYAGAVLPVQVTGVYPHPAFKVSLTGKK